MYVAALGDKSEDPTERLTWNLLNGLATHDLSAMRELLGMPQKVISATRSCGGRFLTALFQLYVNAGGYKLTTSDGFVAYYEVSTNFKLI